MQVTVNLHMKGLPIDAEPAGLFHWASNGPRLFTRNATAARPPQRIGQVSL